jgi:hypothetical protein
MGGKNVGTSMLINLTKNKQNTVNKVYVIIVAKTIELKILDSISVFINDVKIKQGRATFIVNLVINSIGYSILAFSQKKPIIPKKDIGEIIFKTVKTKSINIHEKI